MFNPLLPYYYIKLHLFYSGSLPIYYIKVCLLWFSLSLVKTAFVNAVCVAFEVKNIHGFVWTEKWYQYVCCSAIEDVSGKGCLNNIFAIPFFVCYKDFISLSSALRHFRLGSFVLFKFLIWVYIITNIILRKYGVKTIFYDFIIRYSNGFRRNGCFSTLIVFGLQSRGWLVQKSDGLYRKFTLKTILGSVSQRASCCK
jgi:hypothetical protein